MPTPQWLNELKEIHNARYHRLARRWSVLDEDTWNRLNHTCLEIFFCEARRHTPSKLIDDVLDQSAPVRWITVVAAWGAGAIAARSVGEAAWVAGAALKEAQAAETAVRNRMIEAALDAIEEAVLNAEEQREE